MEKVKVSKEEYEALKWIENNYPNVGEYFDLLISGSLGKDDKTDALGKRFIGDIINAFVFGYELEKTPEEIILQRFKIDENTNKDYNEGVRFGIRWALNAYDIKIKGVND